MKYNMFWLNGVSWKTWDLSLSEDSKNQFDGHKLWCILGSVCTDNGLAIANKKAIDVAIH